MYVKKLKLPDVSALKEWYLFVPMFVWGVAYLLIMGRYTENPDGDFQYLKYYNRSILSVFPFLNGYCFIMCIRESWKIPELSSDQRFMIRSTAILGIIFTLLVAGMALTVILAKLRYNILYRLVGIVLCIILMSMCFLFVRYYLQSGTMPKPSWISEEQDTKKLPVLPILPLDGNNAGGSTAIQ